VHSSKYDTVIISGQG